MYMSTGGKYRRGTGLGARRTISLEARAAPLNQAEPAPSSPASQDKPSGNSSSDGPDKGASTGALPEPANRPTAGGPADVMQSADDDLDPDTIRAASHEKVRVHWSQCRDRALASFWQHTQGSLHDAYFAVSCAAIFFSAEG